MTDLQEIKDLWAIEKVKPHDKQITHDHIDWLIAAVERLEAENVNLESRIKVLVNSDPFAAGMEQAAKIVDSFGDSVRGIAAVIRAKIKEVRGE